MSERPSVRLICSRTCCPGVSRAADAAQADSFTAVQAESGGVRTFGQLQRQHAHAHQVGAVDALEGCGDHRLDPEQHGAFGGPVAR